MKNTFNRIGITAAAFAVAGCVQQPPVARAPVACEPGAILNEGRNARQYPANCPADPALIDRHRLGLRIAQLEEEEREINYRIASRDGRGPIGRISTVGYYGFGSSGYLVGRRVEVKKELRYLKQQAGITE